MAADTNRYQSLNLDEILEITAADASHSGDLRAQGQGLKALCDKLDQSLESMVTSRDGVEGGFKGNSAQELIERVSDLVRRGSKGHERLRGQPDIFFALSAQSEATHQRMLELRDERDKRLEESPPDEHPSIREDYNQQARQYMRFTTAGYVESVKSMEPTRAYDGPRLPRGEDMNGPEGFLDRTTPGPSIGDGKLNGLSGNLNDGPKLQSWSGTVTDSATVAQHNPVSTVRPQPTVSPDVFGMGGPKGTSGNGSKKKKKRRKDGEAGTVTGPFETSRQVTPPVIGSREGGSAETSGPTGPVHRPDGLLPPVIGARATPMWAPGAGGAGPATARHAKPVVVSPENRAPTKTFGASGAGVRSVEPQHRAEGRVFRSGTGTPERPTDPGFTRQPRTTHGDGDNLNRAVIRNSRALTPEPVEAPKPAEPSAHPEWRPTRPIVAAVIRSRRPAEIAPEEREHDPGPFLTHYNLGRNA